MVRLRTAEGRGGCPPPLLVRDPRPPAPSGTTAANDGRVIQLAGSGVAAASIGVPQRNMHTQTEIVSPADAENAVKLLVAFVRSVDERTAFRTFYFNG